MTAAASTTTSAPMIPPCSTFDWRFSPVWNQLRRSVSSDWCNATRYNVTARPYVTVDQTQPSSARAAIATNSTRLGAIAPRDAS